MILTIGIPHYNDFDGAFFTIQALRMYHDLSDVELLVIDNSGSERLKKWMPYWTGARYIRCADMQGTSYAKSKVFEYAKGDFVLCIDCHVLFMKDSILKLKNFVRSNQDCTDLFYGCLVYDDLKSFIPSMKDEWSGQMWGVWGKAENEKDLTDKPIEIWGHGGGCFGAFRKHWLGFHPEFRGFGGEEGYLAEKYRRSGRAVKCLPFLKWNHRFGEGTGYRLDVRDKIRNYVLGHQEVGINEGRMVEHFGKDAVESVSKELGIDIVCCCPTYGRQQCLNEIVESFLRQDYKGTKRLIVFNDDPRVRYHYSNEQVIVVNLFERCKSLGEKYNKLLSYAIRYYKNSLYMIWPQDDIMLPWALTEIMNSYKKTGCECCYPMGRWFMMNNKIEKFEPTAISPMPLFSESFYKLVGNYMNISVGEDVNFMGRARKHSLGKCVGDKLSINRAYHIYRWGNSQFHISGFRPDVAWEKCREEVEKTMPPGDYGIKPSWDCDYVKLVREANGNS